MRSVLGTLAFVAASVVLTACGTTIDGVRYAWPVESVLTVGNNNLVEDGRHALTFSVAAIAEKEFADSTSLRGKEIRLLRDTEGFYFLTGKKFKNVYVLRPGTGTLRVCSQIEVAPRGLEDPALNQRLPYIEMVDGKMVVRLNKDDIVEGKR
jgi:hypothetical protein